MIMIKFLVWYWWCFEFSLISITSMFWFSSVIALKKIRNYCEFITFIHFFIYCCFTFFTYLQNFCNQIFIRSKWSKIVIGLSLILIISVKGNISFLFALQLSRKFQHILEINFQLDFHIFLQYLKLPLMREILGWLSLKVTFFSQIDGC